MNENVRDGLLAAVRAANLSPPVTFERPTSVETGQVRRLHAYDDDLDTMLVLVLHVDDDSSIAKVISVGSLIDEATVRDLVVSRPAVEFPFDLVLRVDGVATAWTVQLSGTPVVGSLPSRIVDVARRATRMTSQQLMIESEAVGASTGSLRPQTGDPLWWQIGRTAEHLGKLTHDCHEAMMSLPIADPAIVPSLILRGNQADHLRFFELVDAIRSECAAPSPEGWSSFGDALLAGDLRPDTARLLQTYLMEDVLRQSTAESPEDSAPTEEVSVGAVRDLPANMHEDPLEWVMARCARSGERSTRIWTSDHLWREPITVLHTHVGPHRHAIIAEFDDFSEEQE